MWSILGYSPWPYKSMSENASGSHMTSKTEMTINQDTMVEALQFYFDKRVFAEGMR